MTALAAAASETPRNLWKSTGAVLLGIVVVVGLSLGTDQVFHALGIYPPWGEVMQGHALYVLALSYRLIYQVIGSYLTARFAPRNPMRHVWVGAGIGFLLGAAGAVAAIVGGLGPSWYPIALALSAVPCAWLGGYLYVRSHAAR
jgi:hypothetical protein